MQMIYNSEQFAVMQIELDAPAPADVPAAEPPRRGGYEIVDKFARREIYLDGDRADAFRQQVDALVESSPTTEEIDEFLSGYSIWMQQPLVLH
jgi:hypothetical protein